MKGSVKWLVRIFPKVSFLTKNNNKPFFISVRKKRQTKDGQRCMVVGKGKAGVLVDKASDYGSKGPGFKSR